MARIAQVITVTVHCYCKSLMLKKRPLNLEKQRYYDLSVRSMMDKSLNSDGFVKLHFYCKILSLYQVFMKDNLEYIVERKRNSQLEAVAMLIKKRIVGYLQRKKYLKIRNDIITIQKNYKVRK